MESLSSIVDKLNDFFQLADYPQDPSMSHLLPMVYEDSGFHWRQLFEPDFVRRFNGLMLRGQEEVQTIFCAVLPTPQVLRDFLAQARPGDLFFTHHPIDFEMGDPRGQYGRGPLPIERDLLDQLVEKGCSFYAVHAPLDHNREISTSIAMEQALGAAYQHGLYPWQDYYNGSYCTISPTSTESLIETCLRVFNIPYVVFTGVKHDRIERIAIIPGGGDKVELIQEAEGAGAQALIGGEVRSHRGDDYGRAKFEKVRAYLPQTTLSLIGVSHAASEHLVLETHVIPWLERNCQVQAKTIRMENWWR
jgi:putative NIF3 family GTP cyclohydrolase 1 type 2